MKRLIMKIMKWLIMREARFYEIVGILQLALCAESLMSGISRVKDWNASLLCFVAAILWAIVGWFVLEVNNVLKDYEEECARENILLLPDELWERMERRQAHISTIKRITLASIVSLLAIFALIAANLLPSHR